MDILQAAAAVKIQQLSDADCCVYARLVVRSLYGELVDRAPTWQWHLVVARGSGPWGPVDAAVRAGLSDRVQLLTPAGPRLASPAPDSVALCQGWRGEPLASGVEGHTWLYLALGADVGLVVDSTRSSGPRWRGPVSWAPLVAQYQGGVAVAVLRPPG